MLGLLQGDEGSDTEARIRASIVRLKRELAVKTILVVEDNRDFAEMLQSLLTVYGNFDESQVTIADSSSEALDKLSTQSVSYIILDVNLPDQNGYELYEELIDQKLITEEQRIIFLSGDLNGQMMSTKHVKDKNNIFFLDKTCEPEQLMKKLKLYFKDPDFHASSA